MTVTILTDLYTGLHEIIPEELLSIFNESELEVAFATALPIIHYTTNKQNILKIILKLLKYLLFLGED